MHLNTQSKVINPELALQNYQYAREALYNIWHRDLIFKKSVDTRYVEEFVNLFEDLQFEGTEKEKTEERKRQEKQKRK